MPRRRLTSRLFRASSRTRYWRAPRRPACWSRPARLRTWVTWRDRARQVSRYHRHWLRASAREPAENPVRSGPRFTSRRPTGTPAGPVPESAFEFSLPAPAPEQPPKTRRFGPVEKPTLRALRTTRAVPLRSRHPVMARRRAPRRRPTSAPDRPDCRRRRGRRRQACRSRRPPARRRRTLLPAATRPAASTRPSGLERHPTPLRASRQAAHSRRARRACHRGDAADRAGMAWAWRMRAIGRFCAGRSAARTHRPIEIRTRTGCRRRRR